jgi:cytochrome c-type biogenesis protein CcmH/NrfG
VQDPGAEARHRALHELEEAAEANPGSAETWARLGNAYFDADRYEDAIRAYRRSLDIDPENPGVWTDLGVMYRRSGDPREAVRAFDRAVEVDPTHEISRFNKGVVLLHDLEDLEGAIQAWEGLIEINPLATAPNGQPVMSLVEQFKRMKEQE